MPEQESMASLRAEVMELIHRWRPATVADLITMLGEKRGIRASEEAIAIVLNDLTREGKLELEAPTEGQRHFLAFLGNTRSNGDFWGIILAIAALNVLSISPNSSFLEPFRWILGSLAILLFPGYVIQMTLFPRRSDLSLWKRVVLAVGLSIAVTGFYTTILDSTSQGIVLESVQVLFSVHILVLDFAAIVRRFASQRSGAALKSLTVSS